MNLNIKVCCIGLLVYIRSSFWSLLAEHLRAENTGQEKHMERKITGIEMSCTANPIGIKSTGIINTNHLDCRIGKYRICSEFKTTSRCLSSCLTNSRCFSFFKLAADETYFMHSSNNWIKREPGSSLVAREQVLLSADLISSPMGGWIFGLSRGVFFYKKMPSGASAWDCLIFFSNWIKLANHART
jgi:hypothetical protein